jgi:acetyltransferase
VRVVLDPPPAGTVAVDPPVPLRDASHLLGGPGALSEPASRRVLEAAGIPLVPSALAANPGEAVRAADALGYPVVLKGVAAGVPHKSEAGLVVLDLGDAAAVQRSYALLEERARAAGATLDGALVQPLVRGALEALVGVTAEPGLGHFLVAGLGGVHAEALQDAALWHVPADRPTIRDRLVRTRLGQVLTSARWEAPRALDDVISTLLRLQALVVAGGARISAIDVNPLLLGPSGALALDARVVLGELPAPPIRRSPVRSRHPTTPVATDRP